METSELEDRARRTPLFLYIPPSRLIVLSIVSFTLYQFYWIFKNWLYLKERQGLAINPFARGIFGILFCHSLLRQIHDDPEARSYQEPSFSARWLATGWVILMILTNIASRSLSNVASLSATLIPTFLCLVPVQLYINSVTRRRNPELEYYGWSLGHFVCLLYGMLVWAVFLAG